MRDKPRFNQETKNQNLANLLVRIQLKWIDILILPDLLAKLHNLRKPLILRHSSQQKNHVYLNKVKPRFFNF